MFTDNTRNQIKGYLEGFIQGLAEHHKSDLPNRDVAQIAREGGLKPFHEALLPSAIRRINAFERSFSTRLGNTFEATAFHIAQEVHLEAQRGLKFTNEISESAAAKIDELISSNNSSGLPFPFPEQIRQVMTAERRDTTPRTAVADLYFKKVDGSEWFFEIKSPKPNKGQCLEVTQRLLTINAIRADANSPLNTFFAMAYNPYGSRSDYKWTYATRHLDMEEQVLLQQEFWTIVGDDPNTYESVLDIHLEVGNEMSKDMLDQLAFGF